MDFSIGEDRDAVRDLAAQILLDRCSHERSKELEQARSWFDRDLWAALAEANLTALTIPEAFGGSGLGLVESCLVAQEVGRTCAPVPLMETLIFGAMPLSEFGSDAQKKQWLIPVAESGAILTAALKETGSSDPASPRLRATRDAEGWLLDGEKICVPAAGPASCILVPASSAEGETSVFLVEPDSEGLEVVDQTVINRERLGLLKFSGVRVGEGAVLGAPGQGREIVEWMLERARLGIAATLLGVCEEALQRTAAYLSERKQFGRQIGTFQAVQMRCADAFIDLEAMRSTLWQAIWRVDEGIRAGAEVLAAKWWAARAGDRIVHSAQHLHGGIGSDVDYPIHRYFLWAEQLSTSLGGPNQHLADLGAFLVSEEERPSF
jgi:alkylation response protein AidB-like acyl-CoA dehydrogenase